MSTKLSSIILFSKRLLVIAFLFVLPSIGFSQETENVKRIKAITEEIHEAIQIEDYEKARVLNREKRIRLEIEQAISNEDFEKAAKLKRSLTEEEDLKINPDIILTPKSAPEPVVVEKEERHERSEKVREKDTHYSTKPGLYLEFQPIGFGYFPDHDRLGFDVSFRLGSRFSSKVPKKFRVGFDMQWVNLSVLVSPEPVISLAPVRPGIFLGLAVNERFGINYNFNFGPNVHFLSADDFPFSSDVEFGIAATNSVAFRINKFGVGLTYHTTMGVYPYSGYSSHVVGAFVGMKF
ncbi:MAG TPA: UvrB/UvrC motif-containing protein [Brumimicrobium sp.]|nr:UvrB/UvrC motif-containing protein [Brumimicrobium sp.]